MKIAAALVVLTHAVSLREKENRKLYPTVVSSVSRFANFFRPKMLINGTAGRRTIMLLFVAANGSPGITKWSTKFASFSFPTPQGTTSRCWPSLHHSLFHRELMSSETSIFGQVSQDWATTTCMTSSTSSETISATRPSLIITRKRTSQFSIATNLTSHWTRLGSCHFLETSTTTLHDLTRATISQSTEWKPTRPLLSTLTATTPIWKNGQSASET